MKFCLRLPITSTNNNEPAKLAPRFATPTTSDLTILKPGRTHAKKITVKAGLIALLSLMTMLLIMVSVIGVNAINEGSRSIHTLNQILGEELGSLANSSNLTLRARTAASLAVRQREIGQSMSPTPPWAASTVTSSSRTRKWRVLSASAP